MKIFKILNSCNSNDRHFFRWKDTFYDVNKHRYINFTFNEAGGGCQNTGTLAKFGQKTGTFSYFQYILTYF